MMATGKSTKDFFHPLCLMEHQQYKFWSCSVHIVSDYTVAFRNAAGQKATSSHHIPCIMQEHVHGISAKVMSGCMGPELREAAKSHKWADHQHYKKGVHTPARFIFWNFHDIADGSTFNLLEVRVE
eukprot:7022787-Pyramimonas_sp.AAC.1